MEYNEGSLKGKIEELEQNKKLILTWLPLDWKLSALAQIIFKPKDGNETQITIFKVLP